jgi:hypothetical protein
VIAPCVCVCVCVQYPKVSGLTQNEIKDYDDDDDDDNNNNNNNNNNRHSLRSNIKSHVDKTH